MSEDTDKRNLPQSEACAQCAHGCGCDRCGTCSAGSNKEPRGKLHAFNYLEGIPECDPTDLVEVQFKNTRKGYYINSLHIDLKIGDMVAVEAQPGHDIGQVTMTGRLVTLQMRKNNPKGIPTELKRVFRIAKTTDLEKYAEAKAREHDTMIRSRRIAEELELNMKIGDVEYQGDGAKAIFYYIADDRVDFRKLIRVLADTFKIRVEMKQIGARQEAGRIGGIGPCGRPLCCSSWMSNFVSVGTSAARFQDLSMNPQKLAGQCAKLKCCLNFEVDEYMEANKKLPHKDITLETADATYYYFKADILARRITYSTDKHAPVNCVTIDAARAFEIININKQGQKPESLLTEAETKKADKKEFIDLAGQDSLTRFDKAKKKKKKKKPKTDDRKGTAAETADKPTDQQPRQNKQPRQNRNKNRNKKQADNKPTKDADSE